MIKEKSKSASNLDVLFDKNLVRLNFSPTDKKSKRSINSNNSTPSSSSKDREKYYSNNNFNNNNNNNNNNDNKELIILGIRCLQSESSRAVLLNEQAINKAITIELKNRFVTQSVSVSLPAQLPFTKSVTVPCEFPPKNTVFCHLSPESHQMPSPHSNYVRRQNTVPTQSECKNIF